MPTSMTAAPMADIVSPTNFPYPASRSRSPLNCGQYAARPMLNSPTLQVKDMGQSLPRPHRAGPELHAVERGIVIPPVNLAVGEVVVPHAAHQEGVVLDLVGPADAGLADEVEVGAEDGGHVIGVADAAATVDEEAPL